MYGGDLLKGAGFPAMDGWYATIAAPHMTGGHQTRRPGWRAFKKKYGAAPEDYSITSYDAATVIIGGHQGRGRDGQAGDARVGARRHPVRQVQGRCRARSPSTRTVT